MDSHSDTEVQVAFDPLASRAVVNQPLGSSGNWTSRPFTICGTEGVPRAHVVFQEKLLARTV